MGSSPTPGSRRMPCARPPAPNARRAPGADAGALRGAAVGGRRSAQPTASATGSGRITTVSATRQIWSAGMPTRRAWSRMASGLVAW